MTTATLTRPTATSAARPGTAAPRRSCGPRPSRRTGSGPSYPAVPPVTGPDNGRTARAFEALYADTYPRVRATLLQQVRDGHLADDLTQATFTRMWESAADGALDLSQVQCGFAWAMGWANTTVRGYYASAAVRAESPNLAVAVGGGLPGRGDPGAVDPAQVLADHAGTMHLLSAVPDHVRVPVALHILDDLTAADVAALTGLTEADVTAQVDEGITRLRQVLGVTPERLTAGQERYLRQQLSDLARISGDRTAALRTALVAAIAAGSYPPGTRLPGTRVLADNHAPTQRPVRDYDPFLLTRILRTLTRKQLLAGDPAAGYTVTTDGPRLAQGYRERIPARTGLARDLLHVAWPPGSLLPPVTVLQRRWGCGYHQIKPALDEFAALGALTRTPGGRYRVPYLPGTAPEADPDTPRTSDDQILAEIAATGTVPSASWIRTTYRVGQDRAIRLRHAATRAATHAAAKQATTSRRAKRVTAGARWTKTAKAGA